VAKAKGVKRVCIPNRSTKSAARRREQKKPWFRKCFTFLLMADTPSCGGSSHKDRAATAPPVSSGGAKFTTLRVRSRPTS
jgi:hypothetical protein